MGTHQKAYHLRTRYGLSMEAYDRKLEANPRCHICGVAHTDCKKGLCLDHGHETGYVRQFLCHRCNILVGQCERDPAIFHRVQQYIQQHTQQVLPPHNS